MRTRYRLIKDVNELDNLAVTDKCLERKTAKTDSRGNRKHK